MPFYNSKEIEGALQRLGIRLVYDHLEPIALLVCGGSALKVLNIAARITRDVDVMAVVEEVSGSVRLRHSEPLPKAFCQVVMEVGRDLGLPSDWLNIGPKDVLEVYDPPKGMTGRWVRREYGPSLTVYFVSRMDQVHFKLLAAADPKAEPRHLEDLTQRIKPTAREVKAAVQWLLGRKTSAWFRGNVKRTVEALGYEDICRTIPD